VPEEKDQDLAVLAYLKGLKPAAAGAEPDRQDLPRLPGDDVGAFLRAMGYNRVERERLRQGHPHPRNEEKYRAVTIKRFRHYLTERMPERPAEEVAQLAEAWVALTKYDLDLAQRWWTAGVDPGNPGQFASAITAGLRIEDLGGSRQGPDHRRASAGRKPARLVRARARLETAASLGMNQGPARAVSRQPADRRGRRSR
jgi:hypothetical protein